MAIRQVVKIGEEVLRKKSRPVDVLNRRILTLLAIWRYNVRGGWRRPGRAAGGLAAPGDYRRCCAGLLFHRW